MLTSDQISTITSISTDNYLIPTGASDSVYTVSLDDITLNYDLFELDYFVDSFPDWNDFQKMRDQYPSIDKAFNKLKELYDLCKDDWQSLKDANYK